MKHFFTNLLIALLITATPLLLLFAPLILNYNKSGNNTFLLDKDYSHLSREDIISRINQDYAIPQTINLKLNDQKYFINTALISANIDSDKIASALLYRRLDEGIVNYVKYFFNPKKFELKITYDEPKLIQIIQDIAQQVDKPFVPTELIVKNKNITIAPGVVGLSLEQDSLKNTIINNLIYGKFNDSILIETKDVGTIPTTSQIEETLIRAKNLIGKSIIISTSSDTISIDDQTLISWIDFNNGFQLDKVDSYTQNIAKSFARDPIDAIFKFENGKVLEFKPAQNGVIVNAGDLSKDIISSYQKLEKSTEKQQKLSPSFQAIEPNIKNSDVNNLGIKELLGSGTSTFKHSSATRNINITKGSSIVNRILVAPGDTFSFIKSLGEVTLEAGYKQAYIIRQGRTELDVGGGVCQVSTTLFRAMLNAGLNITDRKNHAYRVSYYEEDSKPGFDATVFIPNPDLKFINDTNHHVLIQSILDMDNRRLTYEIYGTSDGRKVNITNYRQWDSTPPPPDVWIDDPTLPAGKIVKDEQAIRGLKTAFDWTVTSQDGSVIHQKTFQSNFAAWAAVYRRGPAN
jgi:vancomycin resistance protein YoaR